MARKSKIKSKVSNPKKIKFAHNTYTRGWKNEILNILDDLELKLSVKSKIRKSLVKYFMVFLQNPNKRIIKYTDWLLAYNPKLSSIKSNNMCQIKIPMDEKDKKQYNLLGSGYSSLFCISGDRMLNSKITDKQGTARSNDILIPNINKYDFNLEITIYKGWSTPPNQKRKSKSIDEVIKKKVTT